MAEEIAALLGAGVGGGIALGASLFVEQWREGRRHKRVRKLLLNYAKEMEEEARQIMNANPEARLSTDLWEDLRAEYALLADPKELRTLHRYFGMIAEVWHAIQVHKQVNDYKFTTEYFQKELKALRNMHARMFR